MTRHWRAIYLSKLRMNQTQLQTIAEKNAINYQPLYLLVEAERQRAQLAFDRTLKQLIKPPALTIQPSAMQDSRSLSSPSSQSNSSSPSSTPSPTSGTSPAPPRVLRPSSSALHGPVPIASTAPVLSAESANAKVADAYLAAISACSTIKQKHPSHSTSANPHLCILALASELASRFHLDNGNHTAAVTHMITCLQAYSDWNADRKRQLLMKEFPNLHLVQARGSSQGKNAATSDDSGSFDSEGLAGVAEASGSGQGKATLSGHPKKDLLLVRNDELFKFHVDDESDDSASGDGDSTGDGGSSKDRSAGDSDSRGGGSIGAGGSQGSSSQQSASHSTFSINDENVDMDAAFTSANALASMHSTSATRPSVVGGAADFDLRTVIKATQAISSELQLDKLLSTLMRIVLTNSGGEKGLLLSKRAHVNGKSLRREARHRGGAQAKRKSGGGGAGPAPSGDDSSSSRSSDAKEEGTEAVDSSEDSAEEDEDDDDDGESGDKEWVVEVESNISEFRQLQPNTSKADYATATFSSGAHANLGLTSPVDSSGRGAASLRSSSGGEREGKGAALQKASSPNPLSRTVQGARGSRGGSVVADDRHSYPLSIVNYVINSKRSVILSDASADRRFSSDPYISSRRIRSVLCTPLIHRNRLVSVLFLENNSSAATFTTGAPRRLSAAGAAGGHLHR